MLFEELIQDIKNSLRKENDIEVHDPNLQQGRQYLSFQNNEKDGIQSHLRILEKTSSNKVKSIKETLENMDATKSPTNVNTDVFSMTQLSDLFNKTLTEYHKTYQTFSDEAMKENNNKNQDKNTQYHDKIIENDGDFYYINKFGYNQRFTAKSWGDVHVECPLQSKLENIDISSFPSGAPMGIGVACNMAGTNVQNKDNPSQVAWIDIQGYKHEYPMTMKSKPASCENINTKQISQDQYNNIPSKEDMTPVSTCQHIDMDKTTMTKLKELNDRLIYLTTFIKDKVQELTSADNKLTKSLQTKQQSLDALSSNLEQTKDKSTLDYDTITGEFEDRRSQLMMNKTHLIFWIILLVVISIILWHTLFNKANNLASIVIIIICSIFIYNGIIWLWKNYNYRFF